MMQSYLNKYYSFVQAKQLLEVYVWTIISTTELFGFVRFITLVLKDLLHAPNF